MNQTACGPGSTLANTESLRAFLCECIGRYDIKTINDVGCGDLFWISKTHIDIDYTGYDEVIRDIARKRLRYGWNLERADITADPMRKCDLSICKDVLRHHGKTGIDAIISNMKSSSRYLIADYDSETQLIDSWHKTIEDGQSYCLRGNKLNLCDYLGYPIESVSSDELDTKRFGLWELK
jgi:hypothetical protein